MSEGISWIAFLLSAVSVVVNIATWVWLYKYRMKLFSSVMNGHHQLGVPCSMENSVLTNGGLGNGGSDPLLSRSNSGEEYHTVPLVRIQQERNEFDDEYSRNSIYAPTANASVSFDNKNMPHQKNQALRVQSISTDEDISNADDSNNMNPIIVESDVRKIVDEQVEKLKESLYHSIVHQMTQVTEHQNFGLKQDLNSELSEKMLVQQRTITKINSQVESMSTELQNQLQGIQRTLSEENSQVRAEMTKSVNALDQNIGQLSLTLTSKFNSLSQSLMETKRFGEEREKQHLESISALESRLKQQESLLMMIDADQSSTLLKPSYGLSPSVSQMSINTITSTGSEEQRDIKSPEEASPQELRTNVPAATEDSYLVNPFDISGIGITVTGTGKTLHEAEESYDLSTSSSFSSDRSDDGQTTTNDDVQDEEKRNAITESVVNEDYFYESDDQPM